MNKYILKLIGKYRKKRKWRRNNQENDTVMGTIFNEDLVNVGIKTYGVLNVINHSDEYRLRIGNYCSIAPDVLFIVCGDHPVDRISTFPFKAHCLGAGFEAISNGDIIVEDDVWIGTRATILSGVTIGQGAVVAAGAVVTHDVPPYCIVAGVPARVINRRFSEDMIKELMKIDYSKLKNNWIITHIDDLYKPVHNDDVLWISSLVEEINKSS